MDSPHHSLPEGTLIGERFEVQSVLGVGGFGITYKGWDQHLACEVAIKEYLPLEFAARGQGDLSVRAHGARNDEYRYGLQRFLDEARTLARFRHPNVVRVLNFLEANGTAYLVMDYEEGESLGQYLKRTGAPLTEKQVRAIAEPILRGLSVVHAAGFLHRDVKPGNIYLRREGEPLLIDFGAARQALGEHSRSVTGIVSAGYAPPEQYSTDAKKQGPWTDLYGLGATLYRCITGEDPVDSLARREAQSEGEPDPLRPAVEVGRGRYAEELLTLLDVFLALSPTQRPRSTKEVLELLGTTETPKPEIHMPGLEMISRLSLPAGEGKVPVEQNSRPAVSNWIKRWNKFLVGFAFFLMAAIVVFLIVVPVVKRAEEPEPDASPWARRQTIQYPFGEAPFGGDRTEFIRGLMLRSASSGFRGTLLLQGHAGQFCLVASPEGWRVADAEMPIGNCDVRGFFSKQDARIASARQSPEFRAMIASQATSVPGIHVQVEGMGDEPRAADYPTPDSVSKAGQWNDVAAANNRISIAFLPDD